MIGSHRIGPVWSQNRAVQVLAAIEPGPTRGRRAFAACPGSRFCPGSPVLVAAERSTPDEGVRLRPSGPDDPPARYVRELEEAKFPGLRPATGRPLSAAEQRAAEPAAWGRASAALAAGCGSTRFIDDQTGRILEALRRRGFCRSKLRWRRCGTAGQPSWMLPGLLPGSLGKARACAAVAGNVSGVCSPIWSTLSATAWGNPGTPRPTGNGRTPIKLGMAASSYAACAETLASGAAWPGTGAARAGSGAGAVGWWPTLTSGASRSRSGASPARSRRAGSTRPRARRSPTRRLEPRAGWLRGGVSRRPANGHRRPALKRAARRSGPARLRGQAAGSRCPLCRRPASSRIRPGPRFARHN